jgi:hypothetical protein
VTPAIPTTEGLQSAQGTIRFTAPTLLAVTSGEIGGMHSVAAVVFRPDAGQDCVQTPITGMTLELRVSNVSP